MGFTNNHFSRRDFLKHTAIGAVGIGIGSIGINGLREAIGADSVPDEKKRSTVVAVKDRGIISKGTPDQKRVQKMVDEGMFALTGKKNTKDAWRCFFTPEDIVGIKVNPIGGKMLSTRPEVVNAIILGLVAAGVKENNIIVWDRFEEHLVSAGYELNRGTSGVRYYGTEHSTGYDRDVYYESHNDDKKLRQDDGPRSLFSRIVTQQATAIINVPVMKDHGIAGVTLCLKNIGFGVINNTPRFHPSPYYCDPASAEVCAHPAIKDKLRLHIVDALQACFSGGPRPKAPNTIWNEDQLFFGTDPVAIDRIGLDIIDAKRRENRLNPVFQKAKHIANAEKKGIGKFDMKDIEYIKLRI
ncbi:MAG: DUF362 domain-containing protein [Candidatus Kuenenia sp.]|nr:DUF362 domain-containing protein [Candidatus Kuenenia hertensis]